ncbi:MAG: hypothetical protein J2P22_08130 [Nocardioides sp.]|nr:hypothetical protein [Nocardioides sp.]
MRALASNLARDRSANKARPPRRSGSGDGARRKQRIGAGTARARSDQTGCTRSATSGACVWPRTTRRSGVASSATSPAEGARRPGGDLHDRPPLLVRHPATGPRHAAQLSPLHAGVRSPGRTLQDLAATDILRSRELGVPRYNDFRRLIHLEPVSTFDELTDNPGWAREIHDLYDGDIDQVDLQVGMYAERRPRGFAFSDTAFRIFILMASRRLNSDRFFTDY